VLRLLGYQLQLFRHLTEREKRMGPHLSHQTTAVHFHRGFGTRPCAHETPFAIFARQKIETTLLVFVSFHLHLLADLVGSRELHFMRDPSTKSLTDLVWKTADRLGYSENFVEQAAPMEDDHNSFARRKVPVVDVIDLDRGGDVIFWHTAEDTLDKISAHSLQVTGDLVVELIRRELTSWVAM